MEENAQSRSTTSLAPVQRTTLARRVKPECGVSVTPVPVVVSVWTSLMDMNVRSPAFAILNMPPLSSIQNNILGGGQEQFYKYGQRRSTRTKDDCVSASKSELILGIY